MVLYEAWEQADLAFERAIEQGRLTHDEAAPNWVGWYMYMGEDEQARDLFKHVHTRRYLPNDERPLFVKNGVTVEQARTFDAYGGLMAHEQQAVDLYLGGRIAWVDVPRRARRFLDGEPPEVIE